MYKLSVVTIVKNHGTILKEWIEHYLAEGVDHIYFVDDDTTDNTYKLVDNYKEYITIIKKQNSKLPNADGNLINNIYLNILKETTEWVMFVGIQEYMFSRGRRYFQLYDILKKLNDNVEKIWIPCIYFGSNNYIEQPSEILKSFVNRVKVDTNITIGNNGRVICRTKNLVNILKEGGSVELSKNNIYYLPNGQKANNFVFNENSFSILDIHLNCYLMSKNYYEQKMEEKYGASTSNYLDAISNFSILNNTINEIEDEELYKKLYTYNPDRYN